MKMTFTLLLSIFMITSCASTTSSSGTVKGNGKIVIRDIPIGNYSQILLSNSGELIYEQKLNEKPYLRIETDANLQEYVNAKVRNNTLSISLGKGKFHSSKFKVYTNSPGLVGVKITGSANVILKNTINSTRLDLVVNGSGSIRADKLQCTNLDLRSSGSGVISLKGDAYSSDMRLSGSGSVDASGLKTKNTRCRLSGSGTAKIYVSDVLDAAISGSGGISYKGNPSKINKRISGSGKIKAN